MDPVRCVCGEQKANCLGCTNLYWQLCGRYLIILITSKEHIYRTLLRIERESVNNKENTKSVTT